MIDWKRSADLSDWVAQVVCNNCAYYPGTYPTMKPELCTACNRNKRYCSQCGSYRSLPDSPCDHKYSVCKHRFKLPLDYPKNCVKCFTDCRQQFLDPITKQYLYDCCVCGRTGHTKEFEMYERYGNFRTCSVCAKPRVIKRLKPHFIDCIANLVWLFLLK